MKYTNASATKRQTVPTIAEGLADLARSFLERRVSVATISFTRGKVKYEHAVRSVEPGKITCKIASSFKNVTINVSCNSPLSVELSTVLQSRTNWAAMAAADWTLPPPAPAPAPDLKLVKGNNYGSQPVIGVSRRMRELDIEIDCAARSNHTVLLLGESGTGKTTVAAMIHERSRRSKRPFIDVNCAAIPDALLESELFGSEKGAFTGAVSTKPGLFEAANHGTLFLDEIGELKFELQAKLLTAIEQQKSRRLGSTKYLSHDVRIIAASSRNLLQMVSEGKFRDDLYYRLSVLDISLPPLRQHRDDIPMLVRESLNRERHRSEGSVKFTIDDAAIVELSSYEWPGNIRQLQNVIARLCARTRADFIEGEAVRRELLRFGHKPHKDGSASNGDSVLLPADCRTLMPGESLKAFTVRVKRTVVETVRQRSASLNEAGARLDLSRREVSRVLTRLKQKTIAIGRQSSLPR